MRVHRKAALESGARCPPAALAAQDTPAPWPHTQQDSRLAHAAADKVRRARSSARSEISSRSRWSKRISPVSTSTSISPTLPTRPCLGNPSHTGTRQRTRSPTTSVGSSPQSRLLTRSSTNRLTLRCAVNAVIAMRVRTLISISRSTDGGAFSNSRSTTVILSTSCVSTHSIEFDYTDFAQSINCHVTHTCQRGRYWIASARCAVSMRSAPIRSAMVRASLRVRW